MVLRPGGETRRDAGRAGGAVGALRSIDASDAVVAPRRRSVGWCFFFNSLRGAPTSRRGGMTTTIWRPKVRIDVPDVGDVDDKDTLREELTKKGTKRKICPEALRAVRARGEATLEVQGVQSLVRTVVGALDARSAVGQEYASTVVCAVSARSAVGHQSASTVVSALTARSAVGQEYASTVVCALHARSAVGHQICEHGRGALSARSAVGHQSASTVVSALTARSAVGSQICEHGRNALHVQGVRRGSAICEHGRRRPQCKKCGGSSICEHGRHPL